MRVKYVNHLGEEVDLNSPPFHFKGPEVFDWELSPSTLNGRLSSFRRAQREGEFELVVAAASEEEGLAARDLLFDVADKDSSASPPVPGRLVIDGWWMECWLHRSQKDMWWLTGKGAAMRVGVLADVPLWTRESATRFWATSAGGPDGIDFPHDYPSDYRAASTRRTVDNPASAPSPAKLAVYGPADAPRVRIGANVYEVDAPLGDGDILVVDGLAKTITRRRADGSAENAFWARRGEQRPGSGSYVFEPVAPGLSEVSWDGSFGFDLTLYERRAERRWL